MHIFCPGLLGSDQSTRRQYDLRPSQWHTLQRGRNVNVRHESATHRRGALALPVCHTRQTPRHKLQTTFPRLRRLAHLTDIVNVEQSTRHGHHERVVDEVHAIHTLGEGVRRHLGHFCTRIPETQRLVPGAGDEGICASRLTLAKQRRKEIEGKHTLFASIVHGRHRVFVLTQIGDLLGRQIKPIDISVPHSCTKHDEETQRTLVCPYPTLRYTRAWHLQTCRQAQQRGDQISLFARWQRHRRGGLSRQHISKWRHRWKLTLGIPCPRKRPIADLGLLARNALERRCQREVKTARNGL